jgi:Zn-dependent protease
MSDSFSWSIPLGRIGGVSVRLHIALTLFVVGELLQASLTRGFPVASHAAWLALLLLTLALHEIGHALAAWRLGVERDDLLLWPLGNIAIPTLSYTRGTEAMLVAAAGPAMNLFLAFVSAIGLNLAGAQMVFYPFGNSEGGGAPILADGKTLAATFTPLWYLGWFGFLNWIMFLANMIPALPFDNGRIFRGIFEGPTRDTLVGPWVARTCAFVLGLAGLIRLVTSRPGGFVMIGIGVVVYMVARLESRMLEEGGYLDDTLFGYDFSQGYTSLDAGAATVRPRREGALKRWRNRRSEARRQRRIAKEAAQDQRTDEILAKLHSQGRSSLTDEENRFLIRVSAEYKKRDRPHA